MPNPLSLTKIISSKRSAPSASSAPPTSITDAENTKWRNIGAAEDHLLKELTNLYWIGIESELESVLVALRSWQNNIQNEIEEEADRFVHGFDTFIDQVTEDGRAYADKVEQLKKRKSAILSETHLQALAQIAEVGITERRKAELKKEIRNTVAEDKPNESLDRRRARLLLQSLGILDIAKLIEHRPPLDGFSFWKRPSVPQLKLHAFSQGTMPILQPLLCTHCKTAISGSMYCHQIVGNDKKQESAEYLCEDCYLKHYLGKPGSDSFVKRYKHCILNEIISPRLSRKICMCDDVSHYDNRGMSMALFPVDKSHNHRKANVPGAVECGLLTLGGIVAEAKYEGMRRTAVREKQDKKDKASKKGDATQETKVKVTERPKTVTKQSQQAPDRDGTTGTAVAFEEDEADEDIPFLIRQYAEKYPFGNVHMALQVGPLVIENGVKHTKEDGALISLRDPPNLQSQICRESSRALALSDGPKRNVWWQNRPRTRAKRFKSIMKQVVGTPFAGVLQKSIEDKIIDKLLLGSKHAFDDDGLSNQDRSKWVHELLAPCIVMLKELISNQLSIYLRSLTSKLIDRRTKIVWSPLNNNCQNFCDSLLDLRTFGSLVSSWSTPNSHDQSSSPLYLMSFVCRTAGYAKPKIKNKYDVPNGLTEEYLLRFRYGRHDEADIIDTLQEYWYDWGAFGKHLYQYQDLFPWDCTEAFGRYPTTCGDCNLSKHLWAFPFDSWSIISLHLTRDRYHYPSSNDTEQGMMSDAEWTKNRLRLLTAQEILTTVAVAMARSPSFRAQTAWLHQQPDPALDRLKLGGIHRAQPFSHYYDQGKYQHYFIASWAHLKLQDQIAEYELLRDGRVRLPDVEYSPRLYKGESLNTILKEAAFGAAASAGFDSGGGDGGGGNCGSGCGSGCSGGCGSGCGGGCGGGGCGGGGCGGG